MTKVVNLSTKKELIYSYNPRQAVIAAYRLFDKHDGNLLSKPLYDLPIYEGNKTIACGDWCAFK